MEFNDVIQTRRSVRKYLPKDIPEGVLQNILKAALTAPTGSDKQTWHLYLARSPEVRERLGTEGTTQRFVKDAPVIVACAAEGRHLADAIIAVDHLVLAARNEGVGTCWVGYFDKQKVKEILGVPEEQEVVMLIPMGYPESDDAFTVKKPRARLEEICTER